MGVIEHLPHTPRILLENIYSNLSSGATFFLDVPNLFYSANIAKFFRGIHIQQPIQTVYESGIPFVGHHREYNVSDLRFVLERSGFEIHKIDQFNYSTNDYFRFLLGLGGPVLFLAQFKPFKEVIFVESRKP
jgi:hypothetical protein